MGDPFATLVTFGPIWSHLAIVPLWYNQEVILRRRGMQLDMFDENKTEKSKPIISEKQKLAKMKQDYDRYIRSTEWKNKRKAFIKLKNGKCERCGCSRNLQVHHIHYRTFGKERVKDVEVLCFGCHEKADQERKRREAKRSADRVEEACFDNGFRTWLKKRFGPLGDHYLDDQPERDRYIEWLESKSDDPYYGM